MLVKRFVLAVAVAGIFAGTLAGCTARSEVRDYFSPPEPFPGPTWTRDGSPVNRRTMNSIAGPDHCEWQSAVLLHLPWPPGSVSAKGEDARQYVRDPGGVVGRRFMKGLRSGIAMPADARDTGYRSEELELWFSPSDPGGAYVRVKDDVERWPRADPMMACA